MNNNRIFSIFLMVILFLCVAFLDFGYTKFEDTYGSQLQFVPLYWYKTIASIFWAAMVLGVARYVLAATPRSYHVAFIYLLIGILVLFLQVFWIYGYLLGPATQSLRMRMIDIIFFHLSLTVHTAAMIAMIGAARLLPDRLLRPTDAHRDPA